MIRGEFIATSLFALRYSQKGKRELKQGRRYTFGKVEQCRSGGNLCVVTLRLLILGCQEKSKENVRVFPFWERLSCAGNTPSAEFNAPKLARKERARIWGTRLSIGTLTVDHLNVRSR
jgi:hypothetical protein